METLTWMLIVGDGHNNREMLWYIGDTYVTIVRLRV